MSNPGEAAADAEAEERAAAAEEAADDRAVAALEEMRERAIKAEEEETAERQADRSAEAVTFWNSQMSADLFDDDYYAIKRLQMAENVAWVLRENALRAEEKLRREEEAFNRWVLNNIAQTQRLKRQREERAADNAADLAAAVEEREERREFNRLRMAAERRESLNARQVPQDDACFGF